MARQNGSFYWATPTTNAAMGDSTAVATKLRVFTATERVVVVEVGALAEDSLNVPANTFSFRVNHRTGGVAANDVVISVWKAAFAAEGGPGGDSSNSGFDNANAISGGVITNTASGLTAGKALRAFTEVTLAKGDQLVFEVVGTSAGDTVVFYAKAYPCGSGIVEACDVDSN